MNLIELHYTLKQLRLGGMAAVLERRLQQAQAEAMAPIDLISCLVTDELTRRGDRLLVVTLRRFSSGSGSRRNIGLVGPKNCFKSSTNVALMLSASALSIRRRAIRSCILILRIHFQVRNESWINLTISF